MTYLNWLIVHILHPIYTENWSADCVCNYTFKTEKYAWCWLADLKTQICLAKKKNHALSDINQRRSIKRKEKGMFPLEDQINKACLYVVLI